MNTHAPAPGGDGKPRGRREPEHRHPGGAAAVLGVRLLRYSGLQGTALAFSNVVQLASIVVIANFLGPADLGRFALLLFLGNLITLAFSLVTRPGTIRRTFGAGDDDDDEDDDTAVSTSPPKSLGVGLAWATALGLVSAAAVVLLREPIAGLLLRDDGAADLVVWAGVLGGAGVLFKLASISLWLEQRPRAFLLADGSRPTLGLIGVVLLLAAGMGVEGAIMGTALGTAAGAALCVVLLRGSFEPSFDPREVMQIIAKGAYRMPIIMSMWTVQNADIFVLSRFVDHADLGVYQLASRLGFVVAILPQGFRVAMRPLRKSAIFDAIREQYGQATARGQLLGYFALLCIFAVLTMVLLAQVIVQVAPPEYSAAAALVPFTAAALVMPPLYRTINQNVSGDHKRLKFVLGAVFAALAFLGVAAVLVPEIGLYGAPVAMLFGFAVPSLVLFVGGQRGRRRISFPYSEVGRAALLAAALAASFQLLPELPTAVQLLAALAALAGYLGLLVAFRVIPEYHWQPLVHMARSVIRGSPAAFKLRAGLGALEPDQREALRRAVLERLPAERLAEEGTPLVRSLRTVARSGGLPLKDRTKRDSGIAVFLFESAPLSVRNATMRRLVADGASSNDLHALEDLVFRLSKAPPEAWRGERGGPRRRRWRRSRAPAGARRGA